MFLPSEWMTGIGGNFDINTAVSEALPSGTRIVSASSTGISAWTKTAKVSAILANGQSKSYFLKCATGTGAKPLTEGEYHSTAAIDAVVPGLVPKPAGCGVYMNGSQKTFFFIGDYHDMDFSQPPGPEHFAQQIAELHEDSQSPTGKFGFPVATACGIMERTVRWETSWAQCFINQLNDVFGYDLETNGPWPELERAYEQLVDVVIPRLLGALQSEGRTLKPSLIHGDLWERNVGIDMATGDTVLFDAGSTYAHNEMEFGTWRCTWAYYFNSPAFMRSYKRHIEPSEPSDEWDDRNRLYSLHPYFNDSAGHAGSASRKIAYNDIIFLCEKYGPLEGLAGYDPELDISVTGQYVPFEMKALE